MMSEQFLKNSTVILWSLFLTSAFLLGCQASSRLVKSQLTENLNHDQSLPRLNLFLSLKDPEVADVRMKISLIEISSEGQWVAMTSEGFELDSNTIGDSQLYLASGIVSQGSYKRLRITISRASIRTGKGNFKEILTEPITEELALNRSLYVDKEDSRCLFFVWDVASLLQIQDDFRSSLSVNLPVRQLPGDLVYASCPEIDTIFIIRCDKNWVADSFGLKGHPTNIYLNKDLQKQEITVLSFADSSIKVVDLSTQRIIDQFHIPLFKNPQYMVMSPNRLSAYVLDQNNNFLNYFDLTTGNLSVRSRTGYHPQYAAFLNNRNLIAVSSGTTQTISLHDAVNLNLVGSIQTGSKPDGLLESGNLLYIAESRSNNVAIYDFSANRIKHRVLVGSTPRRLLDNGAKIYVSNYEGGSISVLRRGQFATIREIFGLGRPMDMIFNQAYNRLYVSDEQANGLVVIDTNIDKKIGFVDLGARPLGLAVTQ